MMRLHAYIKVNSDMDEFLKLWKYDKLYISKNVFILKNNIYCCDNIIDMNVIMTEDDIEIVGMGNVDLGTIKEIN